MDFSAQAWLKGATTLIDSLHDPPWTGLQPLFGHMLKWLLQRHTQPSFQGQRRGMIGALGGSYWHISRKYLVRGSGLNTLLSHCQVYTIRVQENEVEEQWTSKSIISESEKSLKRSTAIMENHGNLTMEESDAMFFGGSCGNFLGHANQQAARAVEVVPQGEGFSISEMLIQSYPIFLISCT